jgi:twitching motility protein PilT
MAAPKIDQLLETVARVGATDVHLAPGAPPRLRVDRAVRSLETEPLTPDVVQAYIEDLAPKGAYKDFRKNGSTLFAFRFGDQGRFRVFAAGAHIGPTLSLRFLPAERPILEELGLPKIIEALLRRARGLFLVAGPTSSGRSTVLAGMVDFVVRHLDRVVVTVENPIEFTHRSMKSSVVQREVGTHTPSYADAIADARRFAADTLLIGDLPDRETIRAAVEQTQTGCVVLAPINAQSVLHAITRLIEAAPAESAETWRGAVAYSLLGVLSLRLLPRKGTGGLVLAYEFCATTPAIASLIHERQLHRIDSAIQTGKKYGMQLLDDHLYSLATSDVISYEEAIESARSPSELQNRLERHDRGPDESDPGNAPFPVRPDRPPPGLPTGAEPDEEPDE